jgi:hypothetical protein
MMMQNIRIKQAEENWSLHQYNFVAGSGENISLAYRSEHCMYGPAQSCYWLPPVVKRQSEYFLQERSNLLRW